MLSLLSPNFTDLPSFAFFFSFPQVSSFSQVFSKHHLSRHHFIPTTLILFDLMDLSGTDIHNSSNHGDIFDTRFEERIIKLQTGHAYVTTST